MVEDSILVMMTTVFLLLSQLLLIAWVRVSRVILALWTAALAFPSLLIILFFSENGMGRSLALIAGVYAVGVSSFGASLARSASQVQGE